MLAVRRKDFVVSRAPKWCASKGLSVGDRVVAIDGHAVAGQSFAPFVKTSIAAKFGSRPIKPAHFRLSLQSPDGTAKRDIDVVFDDKRNFTLKYP